MSSDTTQKLVIIVPPGRFRELLSSLTLPVAVVRLCNWVQRELPHVECHVIEGPVAYGHPVTEAGELKTHRALFDELDTIVDEHTLVGFSTFANRDIVHSLPLAREVKRRYGSAVVMGGYAASTCPALVAESYPDLFDGVVAAAGEYAVIELLKGMNGQKLGDRSRVPNLVYWDGSQVRSNPKKMAPRLEEFPPLDLSVLHHAEAYEQLPYFATAGCPFTCDFCYESLIYPVYDKNKAEFILRDLDRTLGKTIDTPFVSFVDPLFGADKKVTLPLLRGLKERGIKYTLYTRADILDEEAFELMEGQCRLMFIGLEAVTESSLMYMNKTHNVSLYMQQMQQTMELCFRYGVTPQVGVIPNYPLNTRNDVDAMFGYFEELRALHDRVTDHGPGFLTTIFNFHIWPGLPHYDNLEKLEEQGLTWVSGFPSTYHGESVNQELRRDVRDASSTYSADEFTVDRFKLYGLAHQTPEAVENISNYVIGYSNSTEARHIRTDGHEIIWTDADRDVMDMRAMYRQRMSHLRGD
jgi:radical SAM superfamily enzyme YgiQ (UPF0313 family)